MARKFRNSGNAITATGFQVLLVDDQLEYLEANQLLLENEGHTVLTAEDGPQALQILRTKPIDLVLLDFFMPGMTGEQVVEELRTFNPLVQVVLQTGYASERPARELLNRLDIQGYHDKSDGPEKLLLWTDVGLKAAKQLATIQKSRLGLQKILNATPEMHRIQPLGDLLHGVLLQVCALVGVENSFLSMLPGGAVADDLNESVEGFLALLENDSGLVLSVGTGAHQDARLDPENLPESIRLALEAGKIIVNDNSTTIPLRIGSTVMGAIHLEKVVDLVRDEEILQVFANQATVAIQNAQLYEMATLDPLTGANMRRLFEPSLLRELRNAIHAKSQLSILMIDMDGLKKINDGGGHAAGDAALSAFGKLLRRCLRAGDSVWRFGGDEFVVILPFCDPRTSLTVAERILVSTSQEVVRINGEYPVRASIGAASLDTSVYPIPEIPRQMPVAYFREMLHLMVQQADEELYRSKKAGGNQVHHSGQVPWRTPSSGQS
jgi:diguanylate cyclase (GGDEF)-like protein